MGSCRCLRCSGMMAGLFSAFSTFMMKALSSLPGFEGMKAMQAINCHIVKPSFLFVFFGTGVLCVASAFLSADISDVAARTISAAVIYLVACIVSTMLFNVPLNNRLDAADPTSEDGQALWIRYVTSWSRWNHLRSIATIVTTFLMASAISRLSE